MVEIKEETGHKNVELYILDLASFASVKAFVQKFTQQERRLDILVENAASIPNVSNPPTEDGWEQTSVHLSFRE
jgi:retinol dehydrogenase-12